MAGDRDRDTGCPVPPAQTRTGAHSRAVPSGTCKLWYKWLNRRTRGSRLTWENYNALLRRYPRLQLRICGPGLKQRSHAPEEPAAGNLDAGVCEGGAIPLMPSWTDTGTKLETAETAKENLPLIGISSTRRDACYRQS